MFFEWLRRNQNIVVPFGLVFYSIVLLSYGSYSKRNVPMSAFSRTVLTVVGFVQGTGTGTAKGAGNLWDRYIWLRGLDEENEKLKQENQKLRRENHFLQERGNDNERLRRLLHFRPKEKMRWIPAEVIGSDLSGFHKTIMIDKGSRDGIKPRMAVITYESALVGQILDEPGSGIGYYASQVLLITDYRSEVEVLVQKSRDRGIMAGRPQSNDCNLLLEKRLAGIRPGDLLISSGLGRIFMKGLPAGRVVEIAKDPSALYPGIRVKPIADFSKLEEVMVIVLQEEGR